MGFLLRAATVWLVVLTLQTTLFADVRIAGVAAETPLLVAALSGVVLGPERGAQLAFCGGVAYDMAVLSPIGAWGLVCALVAFAAGSAQPGMADDARWLPTMIGVAASAGGVAVYALLGELLGRGYLEPRVVRVSLIVAVWALLLAPLVLPVLRWMAAPLAPRKTSTAASAR